MNRSSNICLFFVEEKLLSQKRKIVVAIVGFMITFVISVAIAEMNFRYPYAWSLGVAIIGLFTVSYWTDDDFVCSFSTFLGAGFGAIFFVTGSVDIVILNRIHRGLVEDIPHQQDAVGFVVTNAATSSGSMRWLTRDETLKPLAASVPKEWYYSVSPLFRIGDEEETVYGWVACVSSSNTPISRSCNVSRLGPEISLLRASGEGLREMQHELVKATGLPLSSFSKAPIFFPVESVSDALWDRRIMMLVFLLVPILLFSGILFFVLKKDD